MKFPKILIIGYPFEKKSGGGITLSNLFKDWPKDRLAVASNINLNGGLDFSICETYYQLGYNNKLHPFPLNIFLPKVKCGVIKKSEITQPEITSGSKKNTGFKQVYYYLSKFLHFTGVYNFFYKLKITEDFNKWVTDYNPDIIYSQLSNLELIRFVSNLQTLLNKPVALHIMDDWPSKINQPGLLHFYWEKTSRREFKNLLDRSAVLMSISDGMSEEYKTRYDKVFIPFHNPVEISQWLPYARSKWEINDTFRILYTGRIGTANGNSILFMANIIDTINSGGIKMKLDIFTPDANSKKAASMNNLNGVNIKNNMPHSLMPELLSSYDLLFLPLDFDDVGIKFSQFSMPTKVSEYMISGTPVLVFADKRTALAKYALSDTWAYVVSEYKKESLIEALNKLHSEPGIRKSFAERAKEIAIQNENAKTVRENFRKSFILNHENEPLSKALN